MRNGRINGMRSQFFAVATTLCVVASASVVGASSARAVVGVPTVTVTPSTGLTDNQIVQVGGSGIPVTNDLFVLECAGQTTQPMSCDGASAFTLPAATPVTAGPDGTFTTSIQVRRNITVSGGTPTIPTQAFSCAFGCSLDLFRVTGSTASDYSFIAGAPISFVRPHLAVSISTPAALDASRNLVTGWATVTCDVATPVGVGANIGQAGDAGGQSTFVSGGVERDLACVPGAPVLVYITTYDAQDSPVPFALGAAAASVCVVPQSSTGSCTETADPDVVQLDANIQIADSATVRQSTLDMLADPSNSEFRAAFANALRAALDQDSIFRAEFVAALRGH